MALHRGKLAKQPKILGVRALTREDLLRLRDAGRVVPRVKYLSAGHHRLARYVAAGHRVEEVLRITGYSYQRLHTLKQDPAFQELVARYKAGVEEVFLDEQREVHAQAGELIVRGLNYYAEHFDAKDEAGALPSVQELSKIVPDLMDRFGYGKRTTQTNVKVDTARIMESAMARAGKSTVIDGRAVTPSLPSPPEVGTTSPPASGEPIPTVVGIRRRG